MKRVDAHSKDARAARIARRRVLQAGAAALCFGVRGESRAAPAQDAPPYADARAARVALVLGGGGCRGHGHIGVLKALEAAGHRPDLVVGSSVGSLVGALYAAGLPVAELERHGRALSADTLRKWIVPKLGMFGGERIAQFVRERAPRYRTIEALPMRFAAVTTDLRTGRMIVLRRGDLGAAVQASSSLPGLVEPVRIGNRLCVDGNLSAPVPVTVARRLGALRVIAVDVTFPPEEAELGDPFDALYQGFSILTRRLAVAERGLGDVLIEPRLPVHSDMEPSTLKALVDAGERAAAAAMPQIGKLFETS
jgi:NTE family protein